MFFPESVFGYVPVFPFRPAPPENPIPPEDADEVDRLYVVVLAPAGPRIVNLRRVLHAPLEKVPLARLLHLNYEPRPVIPLAAKVQPHALRLQRERRYLRRTILKVPDFPVVREHYVQKIYQHFLVLPVPEHGLEPRIRKDVYILPGALSFTPALFLLHNDIFV